jgi:hypothetical protein
MHNWILHCVPCVQSHPVPVAKLANRHEQAHPWPIPTLEQSLQCNQSPFPTAVATQALQTANQPVPVLVVVQHPISVVTSVPVLAKSHLRGGRVNVLLGKCARVATNKVEAPTIETNAGSQVLEPLNDVVADALL